MKAFVRKMFIGLITFSLGVASVSLIGGKFYSSLFAVADPVVISYEEIEQELSKPTFVKAENVLNKADLPQFQDFPVDKIYRGKFAPLKYKDDELGYKSALQFALDNSEVDFAGHYVATSWSCGMWCSNNAFIDVKTGKVYWSPVRTEVCLPHLNNDFVCDESFTNVDYRRDSKLIVFFGFLYSDDQNDGEKGFHYYEFENGRFKHLRSILVKDQRGARHVQLDEFDEKATRSK